MSRARTGSSSCAKSTASTYINDSKATNLDAVEKALLAQTKPVVLIAGGKDKGFAFETLRPLVGEKVKATVLIGEMAERICSDWSGTVPCEIAHSIADAVERAHRRAPTRRRRPLLSGHFVLRHVQELRRSRRSISCPRARLAEITVMKIPTLFIRKKKLRASAARRSMASADDMDYEEMSEPNMKLSRALLIVLVLHVVAVAGIIAFNTIKSRQGAFPPRVTSASPAASSDVDGARFDEERYRHPRPTNPFRHKRSQPLLSSNRREAVSKSNRLYRSTASSDAGKVYVVVKGDNPVSIAKKLKVSESDLLAVNHIDDPRKLQIGQKLIVPSQRRRRRRTNLTAINAS